MRTILLMSLLVAEVAAHPIAVNGAPWLKTFVVVYVKYSYRPEHGAERYSLFVNGPSSDSDRARIIAQNPAAIFLQYQNMISIERDVTSWANDILENHQDFFLRTIKGMREPNAPFSQRYAWGYLDPYDSTSATRNYILMNPGSGAWAQYYSDLANKMLSRVSDSFTKGIFVDNVWPFYVMFFLKAPKELQIDMNGDGIMDRSDNWAWADAMIQFSRIVRSRVRDAMLIANFGTRWERGDLGFRILSQGSFDGAMNESFAHNSLGSDSASYPALDSWKTDVTALMIGDSLGKLVLAQSLGQEEDLQARTYSLGSFLLGAGEKSYFNYRYHNSYDTYFRFPEFDVSLGKPLAFFRTVEETWDRAVGAYRREFEYGEVFVNPGSSTVHIVLRTGQKLMMLRGGTLEHGGAITWKPQTRVELRPRSAAIVLNSM